MPCCYTCAASCYILPTPTSTGTALHPQHPVGYHPIVPHLTPPTSIPSCDAAHTHPCTCPIYCRVSDKSTLCFLPSEAPRPFSRDMTYLKSSSIYCFCTSCTFSSVGSGSRSTCIGRPMTDTMGWRNGLDRQLSPLPQSTRAD